MKLEKILKKPKKPPQVHLLTMDELLGRPCEVDGVPALFHRWIEEDRALLRINAFTTPAEQDVQVRKFREAGIISSSCSTEVIRETFALVEYWDGTIGKVKPEKVRFVIGEKKEG